MPGYRERGGFFGFIGLLGVLLAVNFPVATIVVGVSILLIYIAVRAFRKVDPKAKEDFAKLWQSMYDGSVER